MKMKIAIIYLTAILMFVLCSCSEITDTAAKELRSGSWMSKTVSEKSVSLDFKGDDAVIVLKNGKGSSTEISGTTIVTENSITINDNNTMNEYKFKYQIYGDKVTLNYLGKEIDLFSVH